MIRYWGRVAGEAGKRAFLFFGWSRPARAVLATLAPVGAIGIVWLLTGQFDVAGYVGLCVAAAAYISIFLFYLAAVPARWDSERQERISKLTTRGSGADRDVGLEEALAFAMWGEWSCKLWDRGTDEMEFYTTVYNQLHQLAADGDIRLWGKMDQHSAYKLIPASFWIQNKIGYLPLLGGRAETESGPGYGAAYTELMACKAEFERMFSPRSGE